MSNQVEKMVRFNGADDFDKIEVNSVQVVILAGGSGERFWPLSTTKTPKQFLKLFGDKSLIRHTYERLSGEVSPEDVYVVTSIQTREKTMEEIPEIPEENIL